LRGREAALQGSFLGGKGNIKEKKTRKKLFREKEVYRLEMWSGEKIPRRILRIGENQKNLREKKLSGGREFNSIPGV